MLSLLFACSTLEARLPRPAPEASFAPSHLSVDGPVEPLADVARCAACHEAEHATWSLGAHAHASFDNPWYKSSVDALRDPARGQSGLEASRHCGGCHDPVLLTRGLMDGPVDPSDPLARLGVTCLSCHAARGVRPDGNASLDLVTRDLVYPVDGDLPSVEEHRKQMLPAILSSGRVCGACHRGFLGPETGNRGHLIGMDDQGSWRGSSYASADSSVLLPDTPVRASCVDCHMTDHQTPGAHTPLADVLGALPAQVARLEGAATIDLGALWIGQIPVAPEAITEEQLGGRALSALDVVVWNTGTGHAFPGGTHDLQDTWIEARLYAADGALLASSGTDSDDPGRARIYAYVLDARGEPVLTHHTAEIVTAAFDRTVAPGGAAAFRFLLPPSEGKPDRVELSLLHRRHPAPMAEAACAATSSATLDGCRPQPITTIDARSVPLGRGEPSMRRAFAHALALSGDVQEQLDQARPSALRALSLSQTDLEKASARWLLARIESRQLRREEALEQIAAAEELIGPHPALMRVLGESHAAVWDFPEAVEAFGLLAARSPDTAAFRDLARACGSVGDSLCALSAANEGLALQPRDPDLLRSLALALDALGDRRASEAEEAWLAARPPDDASDLRLLCDASDEVCERDRRPLPVYPMQAPSDSTGGDPAGM